MTSSQPSIEERATAICVSCGHPLAGSFCSSCGEQKIDPHSLTIRHFLSHTLLHETLHLDGKIWRTLRFLFLRPGFLAQEYCEGRRKPYVNPVRLLITAVILYLLLTSGGGHITLQIAGVKLSMAPAAVREQASIADTVAGIDLLGLLGRLQAAQDRAGKLSAEGAREKFHASLEKVAEPLSFANVLLLTLVLFALFHRKHRLFLAHAVFSAHAVTFVLLSTLILGPFFRFIRLGGTPVVLLILLTLVLGQFLYLTVGIKRFYFAGDARRFWPIVFAFFSAAFLYVLNSLFITLVQTAGAAVALARL